VNFFYIILILVSLSNHLLAEDNIDDDSFYSKGVKHYDNGEFKKSFIIFFNLAQKGNKDAIYNISNMYYEGIGTTQDFISSLKYSWLCTLNGNKKCLKKTKILKEKIDENTLTNLSNEITKTLEDSFVKKMNFISAFKLGYWYERISPEIDLEKSYLWYSVSVSGGVYKAMKIRDRVGDQLEKETIAELQKEANAIFTKNKYFNKKDEK